MKIVHKVDIQLSNIKIKTAHKERRGTHGLSIVKMLREKEVEGHRGGSG